MLIGENGSGKTNVLEAVALGCAALRDRIEDSDLYQRGCRLPDFYQMKSLFQGENMDIPINFEIYGYNQAVSFTIDEEEIPDVTEVIEKDEYGNSIFDGSVDVGRTISFLDSNPKNGLLQTSNFTIFAPENLVLRNFKEEGSAAKPLGAQGQGLFEHLVFLKEKRPDIFIKIQENLEVLGWYDGFDIPNDLNFTEKRLRIKDRYLDETMQFLNQRSANEGFLFLLFYFTLITSPYTPRFFAIDNIDNGMNPKMCMELMRILTRLAKEHGKQVIFTTHNPAILDGLDLGDDEVRLLVASRNKIGHTKIRRIENDGIPKTAEPRRLSELFLDGVLGGLPKNF